MMAYDDFVNYVKEWNDKWIKTFVVEINGVKETKRLFTSNGFLCEFIKNSRKKGFIINKTDGWTSISAKSKASKKSDVERLRFIMNKIVFYLNNSGLWADMKKSFEKLLSFDDNTLNKLLNDEYDSYNDFKRKNELVISADCFYNLIHKGIKTINYEKYDRGYIDAEFEKAIKEKRDYSYRWTKGYDNSIECKNCNGLMCAWYSEEYRGCLNGHYYFALDNKHAIYAETD